MGDVNCSGGVDIVDAVQIIRLDAGLSTNASCMSAAGNTDCDAAVNSTDALRILQYIAGLSNTTPPGCTAIGAPLGPAATSFDLISAALAAHAINDEQALLYRMYASFGDSRLPPQYKGDDSSVTENPAMSELPDAWAGLSQATKDILAPFLLTPPEPGSWFDLQGGGAAAAASSATEWATISPPTVKAKVWYHPSHPGDAATAQKYADALESTIWPNLTQLMGRAPLPDCGAACPSGGGDDRFDIYLVSESVRSYTKWNTPGDVPACKKTPAVMVIRRNASLATLAHEFMHAVQYAFGPAGTCSEYDWFAEASAQWAMDYVYPSGPPGGPPNEEQVAAPYMLDEPYMQLNYRDDRHEYGAYLFPFYLARMKGQPEIVGTMWQNFETTADSLAAVNDALLEHLLGGFEEVWPKVALYDWNRPPVDDYKKLDQLAKGADTVDGGVVAVTLGGASSRDFEVSADVTYLAAFYHHFQFADDSVKSVVFDNTIVDYPHAKVQALVKIGGEWKEPEDWTHDPQKTFCRDIASQHIEDLVIIISYSNWEDKDVIRPAEHPKLTARSVGCTDWVGTASAEVFYFDATFSVTVSGLRFALNEEIPNGRYVAYKLTRSPAATWRVSGTWPGGCTASGEMPLQPADGTTGENLVYGALVIDREESDYQGVINGHNFDAVITLACPWGPGELGWPVISIMNTGLPDPKITEDGRLDGEYLDPSETYGGHWRWHFDPAPPE